MNNRSRHSSSATPNPGGPLRRGYLRSVSGLAAVGLVISVVVHACHVFRIDLGGKALRAVLVGCAIVLAIASFLPGSAHEKRLRPDSRDPGSPFPYAPNWLRRPVGLILGYAILNCFFMFFVLWDGEPQKRDGTFVTVNHGSIVRTLDEADYRRLVGFEWRLASGMSMAGFAGTVLYAASRAGAMLQPAAPSDWRENSVIPESPRPRRWK